MSSSSDSIEKKPKRKIFEDSDDEENNNLTENFDNALKKKQFLGEKGKYLFNLQNTYLSDSRFKLDNKFKGDIDIKKLPSNLKNNQKKIMIMNIKIIILLQMMKIFKKKKIKIYQFYQIFYLILLF